MPNNKIILTLLIILPPRKTTRSLHLEKHFLTNIRTCRSRLSLQRDLALILRTRLSQPVRNHPPHQIPRMLNPVTFQTIRMSSKSIVWTITEVSSSQIINIIPATISVYHLSRKFRCTFSSSLFRPAPIVRITSPASARTSDTTEITMIGTSHGSNFS